MTPSRELATAGASPTIQVDPVSILRGLMRNWWKILGLWLLASLPLMYAIYTMVPPMYTAVSRLEMQPTQAELFHEASNQPQVIERSIETEINQFRTDQVLAPALIDVANLRFVKESAYPLKDLRESLRVFNLKRTNFVEVSLELPDPVEAAAIVNAVVTVYRSAKDLRNRGNDDALKRNLNAYLTGWETKRQEKEKELTELMDRGQIDPQLVYRSQNAAGGDDAKAASLHDVSIEQFSKIKAQLLEVQIELLAAKARLESRTADFQEGAAVVDEPLTLPRDEVDRRIQAAFLSDPMIADLYTRRDEVERRHKHVSDGARKSRDPILQAHSNELARINEQIEGYWEARYPELLKQVVAAGDAPVNAPPPPNDSREKTIPELKAEVEELEHRQASLLSVLAAAELETKKSNSDTYRAQFLKAEIDSIADDEKIVYRKLQELEFRNSQDLMQVKLIDPAAVPKQPSTSKRLKLMAAVPMGVLMLLLGVFSLLEIKAERVGNPDALSTRVQSEVYSLPPIPMARSPRRLGAPGDDDQIDRFIQRLDHLRFAVCGDHPEVGLGRCVLISSAVGSEGKTTLAAQLAARCGHAGHSTLLIDADLRRGALSPLLDVPESLGLSDVLTKEELNVEDVVIPVQGGTFHLLSAGSPASDTSRVFQGRAFGMLIARLRQLYDLIIIDSPPILPVPDALIMGRWTDGVVLASRYDVSRAPQVERARRQLDLAGIPVLGTVINGMRTSDSYYGRYTYSRSANGPGDPPSDDPTA